MAKKTPKNLIQSFSHLCTAIFGPYPACHTREMQATDILLIFNAYYMSENAISRRRLIHNNLILYCPTKFPDAGITFANARGGLYWLSEAFRTFAFLAKPSFCRSAWQKAELGPISVLPPALAAARCQRGLSQTFLVLDGIVRQCGVQLLAPVRLVTQIARPACA